MPAVTQFYGSVEIQLQTGPAIGNITPHLERLVAASEIINGTLDATIIGSTGSLTTIEFEPGVIADLKRAISRLAPRKTIMPTNKPGMTAMATAMFRRPCSVRPSSCRSETSG